MRWLWKALVSVALVVRGALFKLQWHTEEARRTELRSAALQQYRKRGSLAELWEEVHTQGSSLLLPVWVGLSPWMQRGGFTWLWIKQPLLLLLRIFGEFFSENGVKFQCLIFSYGRAKNRRQFGQRVQCTWRTFPAYCRGNQGKNSKKMSVKVG